MEINWISCEMLKFKQVCIICFHHDHICSFKILHDYDDYDELQETINKIIRAKECDPENGEINVNVIDGRGSPYFSTYRTYRWSKCEYLRVIFSEEEIMVEFVLDSDNHISMFPTNFESGYCVSTDELETTFPNIDHMCQEIITEKNTSM